MCYNKSMPCQRTQSKPAENDSCHMRQASQQQSPRGDGKGVQSSLASAKFFSMMAEERRGLKLSIKECRHSKVKASVSTRQKHQSPQEGFLTEVFTSGNLTGLDVLQREKNPKSLCSMLQAAILPGLKQGSAGQHLSFTRNSTLWLSSPCLWMAKFT